MSVEVTIVCDACSRVMDASSRSAAAARASARRQGARVNLRGGKDLCSHCVSEGVKLKAAQ